MQAIKTVKQNYTPTPEVLGLLETFRAMLNDCIRIGLARNLTSRNALSNATYHHLSRYDIQARHRLCATNAAAGMLRNYRKAKRKNEHVKEPYAKRLRFVTCYGFKIENGILSLSLKAEQRTSISLNPHVLATIQGFTVRSVTITSDMLYLAYAKDAPEILPQGFVGIDRNLDNVTTVDSNGHTEQLDLSEATRIKAQCRETKRHLKRNDSRVRKQVYGKYGRIQRNKVQQILHHASKQIVEQAKRNQHGIVMEKLTGIRKLYRKGNWKGKKYRAQMNSWAFAELQRQIQYKAEWEGVPVIYVKPYGTSAKCAECGSRLSKSSKPEERRLLKCTQCGLTMDRDVNAAKNILARGMKFVPAAPQVEAMVSVFDPPVDCGELAS